MPITAVAAITPLTTSPPPDHLRSGHTPPLGLATSATVAHPHEHAQPNAAAAESNDQTEQLVSPRHACGLARDEVFWYPGSVAQHSAVPANCNLCESLEGVMATKCCQYHLHIRCLQAYITAVGSSGSFESRSEETLLGTPPGVSCPGCSKRLPSSQARRLLQPLATSDHQPVGMEVHRGRGHSNTSEGDGPTRSWDRAPSMEVIQFPAGSQRPLSRVGANGAVGHSGPGDFMIGETMQARNLLKMLRGFESGTLGWDLLTRCAGIDVTLVVIPSDEGDRRVIGAALGYYDAEAHVYLTRATIVSTSFRRMGVGTRLRQVQVSHARRGFGETTRVASLSSRTLVGGAVGTHAARWQNRQLTDLGLEVAPQSEALPLIKDVDRRNPSLRMSDEFNYDVEPLLFVPRIRAPAPEEEHRGKKRRNTSEGDGPFVPAWARLQTEGPPDFHIRKRSREDKGQPSARRFVPAWAQPTSPLHMAPARSDAQLSPPDRPSSSHPYIAPAYGKSRLREDQVDDARSLAEKLHRDRTPGRIKATRPQLEQMALAIAEARADGINPRTASKDAFALREFEAFAQVSGFDPNIQTEWCRRFPERESLKMASFLMWRAQRAQPRSRKGPPVAKPMSIYHNYLALRRVFKSRSVELPGPGTVRETLRGLIRRFVRRFGIDQLRPKRVEPVTPAMIKKALCIAREGKARVKNQEWALHNWECFIALAWMVINLSVGSRKGESTKLPGDVDENDWFNRAAVTFEIGGRTLVHPTEAQLRSMKEGDRALLAPRGSKCDQFGTCHGTEPIILPFHDDELNAAKWLRDIELRWPCHGAEARRVLPLFPDGAGQPYSDATFAGRIMATLELAVGETRVRLLSPHSWRVWLASALRMQGASDARIQAMGRWLNPESIKIYARMDKAEYALWVDKLMSVKIIDTARTTNLPIMDAAGCIALWGEELKLDSKAPEHQWVEQAPTREPPAPSPLRKGDKIDVYWTDIGEWFTGTFTSSQIEDADGGGQQRASRIVYDAAGAWANCSVAELAYWHCLDDELWRPTE